jgi:transcriptional regulator with XRE-family HTH domain/tetratricopeptide (TPR) repeat protein
MDPALSFGAWVRRRRKMLDLTQAVLAQRVGCALVTIKKIEQESRRPSLHMAKLLAQHLAIAESEQEAFLRLSQGEHQNGRVPSPDVAPSPAFLERTDEAETASPVVAREWELAQLERHLVDALNGNQRVVFITGEAGQGKTTLMAEFARRAQASYPNLIVAGGNCDAHAGVGDPYLPFRDVLALLTGDVEAKWSAGLLSGEQARRLWAVTPQTVQALLDHGVDLLDTLAPAAALVQRAASHGAVNADQRAGLQAMAAQGQARSNRLDQRQLFEQYTQVLRALATRQPLLLWLDDLQWTDSASAALLFHLGRRLSGSRILILGAYRASEVALGRPEPAGEAEQHPLAPVVHEFMRRYGEVEIDLGRRDPATGRSFVHALLDREPNRLREPFREALFQRTRGHPLFTVELLREMQARGDLVQDGAGHWQEGTTVDWQALPARVEAVIAQSIGRLPAQLQESLRVASVAGESFTAEVVARVQGMDERQLVRQLSSVVDRQHRLIRSQGNQRQGEQMLSHYRFGHALFQHYLYQNLDETERVYLHEAVGQALEQLYQEQTGLVAVQLAHHYQAAGLVAKAVEYLCQAGEWAVRLHAHAEAIVHLSQGLALVGHLPETIENMQKELRLQLLLGASLRFLKGWAAAEVEPSYLRARALCQQLGDTSQLISVLWGLNGFYIVRGMLQEAHNLGQECIRLAQEQADPVPYIGASQFMLAAPLHHLGKLASARSHLEQGISLLDGLEQQYMPGFLSGLHGNILYRSFVAHTIWLLGFPDQSLQQNQEALALAEALSHPFNVAAALAYAAMLHQFRREWHLAQTQAAATITLCTEVEFPYYQAWAVVVEGAVLAEQGEAEKGIAQIERGLADLRVTGAGLRQPYYLSLLAGAYAKAGEIDEGLRILATAMAWAYERDDYCHVAELHRLKGEFLWQQAADEEEVEVCFQQAIAVARQQQAKSLELRAAMSLGRLWQRQGRTVAARQQLAAIYNWFTEGFDTPDLQEAKALLDEWNQN